jgi:hypothetical protein
MSRIVALIAVCWILFITIIFWYVALTCSFAKPKPRIMMRSMEMLTGYDSLPTTNPVTSQTINYTVVAVGIIAIFSLTAWVTWAHRWFVGPMKEIQEAQRLGIDPTEPGALESAEPELFAEGAHEKQ